MIKGERNFNIDALRFIDNSHTTNRQLIICSKIVNELKNGQVPRNIVINKLVKWSSDRESQDTNYNNSRGKITNKGRPTTAINHYFNLCESLGLVHRFNNVYSITRGGGVLNYFYCNEELSIGEKLFYSFQLFNIDADALIHILQILDSYKRINQKDFQKVFIDGLSGRLEKKREVAKGNTKFDIGNKLLRVNLIWKNPIKYAEHMIAPRCEWLLVLGLLDVERVGSSTIYKSTDKTSKIIKGIPELENGLRDINWSWLETEFFSLFQHIYYNESAITEHDENYENLKKIISEAFIVIKSSNTFRLPALETFLFISIKYFVDFKKIINLNDLAVLFESGFIVDNRKIFLKKGARINESYITSIFYES